MTNGNASRAGLGARALALTIDLALVGLLIAGIGLLLTATTGGKVRLGTPIIETVTCVPQERVPAGLRLPGDFKAGEVRRCTRTVLGIEHDWTLVLAEAAGSEPSSTQRRQIVVPLDGAGRLAEPFYLDGLTPLVLVFYLFLFEWRLGATPGKRALAIRVQATGGAPLDVLQAGKRSLMRTVPFLALMASAIYLGVHADPVNVAAFAPPADFNIDLWPWDKARTLDLRGLDHVVWIAFVLNYIVTTVRGTLPWHDRWAGTEAVRQ